MKNTHGHGQQYGHCGGNGGMRGLNGKRKKYNKNFFKKKVKQISIL